MTTLRDDDDAMLPLLLPTSLLEVAISPIAEAGAGALQPIVEACIERHPSCRSACDPSSDRLVLGADSEDDLVELIEDLQRCCHVRAGAPMISHRETITRPVEVTFTSNRRSVGGMARVKLMLAPSSGLSLTSHLARDDVPAILVEAVVAGVAEALAAGVLRGDRVIDVAATLVEIALHDERSAEPCRIAGREACREGLRAGQPLRLQPVMHVAVTVPAERVNMIAADLRSRRARNLKTSDDQATVTLHSLVPLAQLLGYRSDLHALTGGAGTAVLSFHAFEPVVPPEPPPLAHAMSLRG